MNPFAYECASDAARAVASVAADPDAMFLGGGTNLVDHMRLGVANPDRLVDVTRLPFDRVEEMDDGGVRIGANVRNSDLAAHPLIRTRYPMLSQALLAGASGQLRNMATTAGNLLQRTRCVYFQNVGMPCNKRKPGSGCAAIGGYTRYHAIFGASEHCIAVHPSDMAVAMRAIDATVVALGAAGGRRIPLADFHRLPDDAPERDTVLQHGELITAVELPALPVAAHSIYRKVRDRRSYAFALVSVAAALRVRDGTIEDVRIACGGVAHKPWRAARAEETLRGRAASQEQFEYAADAELAEAWPQPGNVFKVKMLRNTLVRALRELAGDAP